jgi:hypothetical protein
MADQCTPDRAHQIADREHPERRKQLGDRVFLPEERSDDATSCGDQIFSSKCSNLCDEVRELL